MDSLYLNLEKRLKELEGKFERLKDITFDDLGDIRVSVWNLEDKLSLVKPNTQDNASYTQPLVSNNDNKNNKINLTSLTETEKKILEMKRQGHTQRAIAEATLTTEANVSQTMKKIRRKLSTQVL